MKNSGFTLVELIVVLALAALILAVGVPSFQDTLRTNRLVTQTNRLIGALNLARSESVKRGVRVTLCPSADGENCADSGGYDQGWIVFSEDPNNPGGYGTFDSDSETLIQVASAVPTGITIEGKGNFSTDVSFVPSGTTAPGDFGRWELKPTAGDKWTCVKVSYTGRVRAAEAADCE